MSKGGSKTRLPAGLDALSLIQAGGARKSIPLRNEVFRQVQEALKTGGVGARIPMIQQAVSQSQQATGRAVSQTSEELAKRNIGGSFAASQLAGVRQAGEQATAGIPTQMAQQLLSQAPTLAQIGYPGAPTGGSASETTPDTLSPAIGGGAAIAAAVIAAV